MRRRPAPGPPWFRQSRRLFGGGAGVEVQSDPHRFLYSEIATRPRIAVAEAEQQIDVGGPRADAMQRRQCGMGKVGLLLAERAEIEALGCKLARQRLQGFDLGGREAEPCQPRGPRCE